MGFTEGTLTLTIGRQEIILGEGYAAATALPPFDVGIDTDLYGINVNYQVPTTEAEIEGYFVDLKNSHSTKNIARRFDYQTWGIRAAHNVASVPGFSYRGETAVQYAGD